MSTRKKPGSPDPELTPEEILDNSVIAGLRNLLRRSIPSQFGQSLKLSPYGNILDDWQKRVLDSKKKNQILNTSRQVGKSTVVAIKALHRAIFNEDQLILIIAPSLRQSQELFKKVIYYAKQIADLPDKVEDNQLSIGFTNGSRIVALPGNPKTVRGFSAASMVIIDEAAYAEPSLLGAVLPMIAISDGDLLLLSTPNGKIGFFWDVWSKGGDDWDKLEVPWWECPRHSHDRLMGHKMVIGDYQFSVEFECRFRDAQDAVFSYDDIMAAMGDVEPLQIYNDTMLISEDVEALAI